MINELDRVILTDNLAGTLFVKGDVGTVVFIHENNRAFEVEFFAVDGSTISVETVPAEKLIPAKGIKKVLHINDLAA